MDHKQSLITTATAMLIYLILELLDFGTPLAEKLLHLPYVILGGVLLYAATWGMRVLLRPRRKLK